MEMSSFTVLPTHIWNEIVSHLEWVDMKHILCDDCYPLNVAIFSSNSFLRSFCERYFFITSLDTLASLSLSLPFKIYIVSNLLSTLHPTFKCYYLSQFSLSNHRDEQSQLLLTAICFRHLIDIFLTRNFDKHLNDNHYEKNTMWQYFHKHECVQIFFTKIILARPYSVLYALEHFDSATYIRSRWGNGGISFMELYSNYRPAKSYDYLLNKYNTINFNAISEFKCLWKIGQNRDWKNGSALSFFCSHNDYYTFFYVQTTNDDSNYPNEWLQSTGDHFIGYNRDTSLGELITCFDADNIVLKADGRSHTDINRFLNYPNFYYGNKIGTLHNVKLIIKHWLNVQQIGNCVVDVIVSYYQWDGDDRTEDIHPHTHCFEVCYPLIDCLHCRCKYCSDMGSARFLQDRYPEIGGSFYKIFARNHQFRDVLFRRFQQKVAKYVTNIVDFIKCNDKICNVLKCMTLMDRMRMNINEYQNIKASKVLKQSIERCIRRIINSLLPLKHIKSIIIKQIRNQTKFSYIESIEYRINKSFDISISNARPSLWPAVYLVIAIDWIKVVVQFLKFDLLSVSQEKRKKISMKNLNKKLKQKGLFVAKSSTKSLFCDMLQSSLI